MTGDRQLPKPDLNRGLIAALAGNNLKAVATSTDDERFDDPFFGDRRHQFRQVAHHLPRLVGIGVDAVDRDLPADRRARRRCQGLDVMLVVPHPNGFREPSPRHGQ